MNQTEREHALAEWIVAADLDLVCMHESSIPWEDAVQIAKTCLAWVDHPQLN